MEEVTKIMDSFKNGIIQRISSPFYGYFVISWSIWNWKVIYTTFFVSSDFIYQKSGLLKVEYITNILANLPLVYLLLLPLVSVIFFVWVAPYVTLLVYKKVKNDEYQLLKINEEIKQEYLMLRNKTLEKETRINKAENDLNKLDPKISWIKEFEEFKNSSLYPKFKQIITTVYTNEGLVNKLNDYGHFLEKLADVDILSYCDAIGLITVSNDTGNKGSQIQLTDKGKFFVGNYRD